MREKKTNYETALGIATFCALLATMLIGAWFSYAWDDLYQFWLAPRVGVVVGVISGIMMTTWMGYDDYDGWANFEKMLEFALGGAFCSGLLFAIGVGLGRLVFWFMQPPPGL